MQERISKKIALTRLYSRRQAESLVKDGKVTVNNSVIKEPYYLVNSSDVIKVNNKTLSIQKETPKLWLFNKPKGYLTSKTDPKNRSTIYHLLPRNMQLALYVGRLDYNSEGLLLLTNNGDLANYLTSAKNHIKRVYQVKTFGRITQDQLNMLKKGIKINNMYYSAVLAKIIKQNNLQTWIQFTLLEGKNNEIRNICKFFNLKVSRLIRTNFGPFSLKAVNDGLVKEVLLSTIQKHFSFLINNVC